MNENNQITAGKNHSHHSIFTCNILQEQRTDGLNFFLNTGNCVPVDLAQHLRRLESSDWCLKHLNYQTQNYCTPLQLETLQHALQSSCSAVFSSPSGLASSNCSSLSICSETSFSPSPSPSPIPVAVLSLRHPSSLGASSGGMQNP